MGNTTSVVMRGSLKDFELFDVLQCVGVSRQYTVIELRNHDGTACGQIAMKSGHVLEVEHADQRGRSAFAELLSDAPAIFTVMRLDDQPAYPTPIGPLSALILEAIEKNREEITQVDPPKPPSPKPAPSGDKRTRPVRVVTMTADAPKAYPPPRERQKSAPSPKKRGIAVAVASPKGGVGKTTISLNLALSLAERRLRTTIVDGDINGDLLSLINARGRASKGAYDFLAEPRRVTEAMRKTKSQYLRILPATGPSLPSIGTDHQNHQAAWSAMIERVREVSDVVIIDCPAGMFHATSPLLRAATHVLGVFQAEIVAQRSFDMFASSLAALPAESRPALLGVVVNMFNGRGHTSLEAFHELCMASEHHQVFETIIPRSDAFLTASAAGAPLRVAAETGTTNVAWLFDSLAAEVCSRLGRRPGAAAPEPFLR